MPASKVLGYILLLMGCGRCWSAGFSRLQWKYPAGQRGLQRKARTEVDKRTIAHSPKIYR
jgi:hypothetical protein